MHDNAIALLCFPVHVVGRMQGKAGVRNHVRPIPWNSGFHAAPLQRGTAPDPSLHCSQHSTFLTEISLQNRVELYHNGTHFLNLTVTLYLYTSQRVTSCCSATVYIYHRYLTPLISPTPFLTKMGGDPALSGVNEKFGCASDI